MHSQAERWVGQGKKHTSAQRLADTRGGQIYFSALAWSRTTTDLFGMSSTCKVRAVIGFASRIRVALYLIRVSYSAFVSSLSARQLLRQKRNHLDLAVRPVRLRLGAALCPSKW